MGNVNKGYWMIMFLWTAGVPTVGWIPLSMIAAIFKIDMFANDIFPQLLGVGCVVYLLGSWVLVWKTYKK